VGALPYKFGEHPIFSVSDYVGELRLGRLVMPSEDLKPLANALGPTKDLTLGSEVRQYEVLAHHGGDPIEVMVVERVE
jgi:hypothetical protein